MKNSLVSRVRRFIHSDSEGGALVEMAVIMLIMTGIFSFSMALYQKLQLAEAVSAAGRQLAIDRGAHDPCLDVQNAIDNGAPGLNASTLNAHIVIKINGTATASGSCPGPGATGASTVVSAGDNAQITVTYPITVNVANIWGGGSSFGRITLASQVSEVVQ
jgi:Flp pilus assembly protein TadG